jgi:hypothetical protein
VASLRLKSGEVVEDEWSERMVSTTYPSLDAKREKSETKPRRAQSAYCSLSTRKISLCGMFALWQSRAVHISSFLCPPCCQAGEALLDGRSRPTFFTKRSRTFFTSKQLIELPTFSRACPTPLRAGMESCVTPLITSDALGRADWERKAYPCSSMDM